MIILTECYSVYQRPMKKYQNKTYSFDFIVLIPLKVKVKKDLIKLESKMEGKIEGQMKGKEN